MNVVPHLEYSNGGQSKKSSSALDLLKYIDRDGKKWEQRRGDLVHHEAGNLPSWAEGDPHKFFAAADKYGKGNTHHQVEVALPHCCTQEERIELARRIALEIVGDKMPFNFSVHNKGKSGIENWHVHILYHSGQEDGRNRTAQEWFKAPDKNYRHRGTKELIMADPEKGGVFKNKAVNSRDYVSDLRQTWERTCNQYLAEKGYENRVDMRSYGDQFGRDEEGNPVLEPGIHVGNGRPEDVAFRIQENEEIQRRNGEKLIENPGLAVQILTQNHSTFTYREIQNFAFKHSTGDEQWEQLVSAIASCEQVVQINDEIQQVAEKQMLNEAETLANDREKFQVSDTARSFAKEEKTLSADQEKALDHILDSGRISCVVGVAGAGKSYMLDAARDAYQRAGFRVQGLALAGKAAEGLEESSGIESRTIASFLMSYEKGKAQLSGRDVLVIDEAAMVGTGDMRKLVNIAALTGAKLVLVGDAQQLQAIENGGAFKQFASRFGTAEINEVRRQKEDWQETGNP